jgi:hypothetical protein
MTIAEEIRRKELKDIETQMETSQGRRLIWRILEKCNVFATTWAAEANLMSFREGGRNIGLMLLQDVMEAAPKKYMVMMLEANEARERINLRILKEQEEAINEE